MLGKPTENGHLVTYKLYLNHQAGYGQDELLKGNCVIEDSPFRGMSPDKIVTTTNHGRFYMNFISNHGTTMTTTPGLP